MRFTWNIPVFLTLLALYSCARETDNFPAAQARGLMSVTVKQRSGGQADKIETARFIVFNDASGLQMEFNEIFDVPAGGPSDGEVSEFEITLGVSMNPGAANEKTVVAIINEPAGMKTRLDRVQDYNSLANLMLDFTEFLDDEHAALQSGKTMPMTGAVRTGKVYATAQEAAADPCAISLVRAVARVEVYFRKEAGADFDVGTGSEINLRNTYNKGYLLLHSIGGETFGKIQSVTSGFLRISREITAVTQIPDAAPGDNGILISAFYTPERTCRAPGNADKLILDINAVSSGGEARTANVILDGLYIENVYTALDNIERNNVYRIVVTVTDKGLTATATLAPWNDENFPIEF